MINEIQQVCVCLSVVFTVRVYLVLTKNKIKETP